MKIGFVLPIDILSGGVFVVLEHATRLEKQGHEVSVIFKNPRSEGDSRPSSLQGLSVITYSWPEALAREFDVVVASWWETAIDMLSLKSSSYAYFVQSDERRFYPSLDSPEAPLIELTYLLPVHFITEARWIRDLLENEFGQTAAVARNGVSREIFYPREPIEAKPDGLRIMVEGASWVPYKRIRLALEAAKNVTGASVWYVSPDGNVPDDLPYDRLFCSVPRSEMPEIYSSCDVLLKLSTVEGFFCPPLEMMACGGTVVVSAVTGHDEFVVHGKNGLVVPLDEQEAATTALVSLRDDKGLLDRLRAEAKRTADGMEWEPSTKIFEDFLLHAVQSPIQRSILLPISRLLQRHREILANTSRQVQWLQGEFERHVVSLPDHFYTRAEAEALPLRLESHLRELTNPLEGRFAPLQDRITSLQNDFDNFFQTVRERFDNLGTFLHTRAEAEKEQIDVSTKFKAYEQRILELESGLNDRIDKINATINTPHRRSCADRWFQMRRTLSRFVMGPAK